MSKATRGHPLYRDPSRGASRPSTAAEFPHDSAESEALLSRLAAEWRQPELQSNAELLIDYAVSATGSVCGCWYRLPKRGGTARWLTLTARVGYHAVPGRLPADHETILFLRECGGAVVQLTTSGPFPLLLLHDSFQSAAALTVRARSGEEGLLIVASHAPYRYNGAALTILEQLGAFAGYASYRRTQ